MVLGVEIDGVSSNHHCHLLFPAIKALKLAANGRTSLRLPQACLIDTVCGESKTKNILCFNSFFLDLFPFMAFRRQPLVQGGSPSGGLSSATINFVECRWEGWFIGGFRFRIETFVFIDFALFLDGCWSQKGQGKVEQRWLASCLAEVAKWRLKST